MSDDHQLAVRVYQDCLRELQRARAVHAEAKARQHRLRIDRDRLGRAQADAEAEKLAAEVADLEATISRLHTAAEAARNDVRRFTDLHPEPDDVVVEDPGEGFQQPPFSSS